MLSIFSCVCWPSICLLWKNVKNGLCPFLNHITVIRILIYFGVEFRSSLCILDISPLLDISFANIFSNSVGCLSCFVGGVLCCAKLFYFGVIPIVYFCFCFWLKSFFFNFRLQRTSLPDKYSYSKYRQLRCSKNS